MAPPAVMIVTGAASGISRELASVLAARGQPVEVILPPSRGVVAHAVGLFPGLARRLGPLFQARGRARQQALLRGRRPEA